MRSESGLERPVQAMGCELQQLGRGVQIDFCADDIHMPHVGREPRQSSMEVRTLAIPSSESLNGEGVSEIVRSRSNTSLLWF